MGDAVHVQEVLELAPHVLTTLVGVQVPTLVSTGRGSEVVVEHQGEAGLGPDEVHSCVPHVVVDEQHEVAMATWRFSKWPAEIRVYKLH